MCVACVCGEDEGALRGTIVQDGHCRGWIRRAHVMCMGNVDASAA